MSTGFSKGMVDPTLFTRKTGKHILLVQIYIDDIIFTSTNPQSCETFSKEMSSTFKMSMMGQMSIFLGLQVSQNSRGIFINQSKYAIEILKKYRLESSASIDTPMVEKMKLDEDRQGKLVDPIRFHGMVGSLMYLSASRPNIVFDDFGFALRAFADADYAGCQDTRAEYKRRYSILSVAITSDSVRIDDYSTNIAPVIRASGNMVVEVYFVETKYQLADIFTKALPRERFELLLPLLGMKQLSPETFMELQESANE
nr:hypothetical protein [Tanacetum cinerariifolium]